MVALVHVALVLALLKYAQAPDARDQARPVDYIAFAFIAAPKPPAVVERTAALPMTVPSRRPRPEAIVVRKADSPPAMITLVPAAPPSTDEQPAPPADRRLDMDSLRAAARQVDSERAPLAMGARREAEQLRSMDDTALSRAVQRAKQPDCQTKYAGGEKANILLLIPLAIDTVTGKGCNW